mgnify:CR=1 FL=1
MKVLLTGGSGFVGINIAEALLETGNILVGYGNTLFHIAVALPVSMFMTFSLGYVLSRPAFPGRKLLYIFVLITMLFSGGGRRAM